MPYIGNQPAEQFTSFATQEFSTSATTSYTLDHAVTNENEIALFINNVRQQPGSGKAYTASSTTLTLSAATASTDTMYCVFLGRALQTVTPATNSVTSSMLGSNFFTGATDVGADLADADLLLIDDGAGGTLRKTAMSRVKTYVGGGITVADQFRLTANTNAGVNGDVTSNWERVDNSGWGGIGTGLTESSGIFSFPSTGIYLIIFTAAFKIDTGDNTVDFELQITTDNSSYGLAAVARSGSSGGGTAHNITSSNTFLFDVTNTTNYKFKFVTGSFASSASFLRGNTNETFTAFSAIRLGDT